MGADSDSTEPSLAPSSSPGAIPQGALRAALEGRYALEGEVAHGAMGTVLRARDLRHDRLVAIKVLRPELVSTIAADRFLREVHTAAGLTHPNIVTVHDSGEAAGLLYYVMPYEEGESLRDRLAREHSLPAAEALRIAGEVAEALAFAHAHGIVHRDVKPANILLGTHGHALVTDFGVARALSDASDAHLTGTGNLIGSPTYLSPEQANADAVDGRADVYSLGCVLYEMLCGRPPFERPTLLSLLSAHLAEEPPPLSSRRPGVPAEAERVVAHMLRKPPAERPDDAQLVAELASAAASVASASGDLSLPPGDAARPARRADRVRRVRLALLVLLGASLTATALAVAGALAGGRIVGLARTVFGRGAPPDSSRYVVFPFRSAPGLPAGLLAADRVHEGLLRWQGFQVLDPGDAGVRLSRDDSEGVDAAHGRDLARTIGAGRFVTGRIARDGDSLRIHAELGDAAAPARTPALAQVRVAVPLRVADAGAAFGALADSLALAGIRAECVAGQAGTRLLPAVRACDRAFAALDEGDRPAVDSLLTAALRADPRYARAALWLAQERGWLATPPPASPELIAVASAGRTALPPRERTLLDALRFMNAGGYADACAAYSGLTAADSLDVVAWLGMGECHRRDDIVVRDGSSPSGWAFRSSYDRGVVAYRRAFEIRPQLMRAFDEHGFAPLRKALHTSTSWARPGRASPPDTLRFDALPELAGDTLRFTPFPLSVFTRATPATVPAGLSRAVDRQRRVFRDLAVRWAATARRSARAAEAVAVSLDLMGDPAAVDAIDTARARAGPRGEGPRFAQEEVFLRVKFGLPDRLEELGRARALADSLLQAPDTTAAGDLISLALMLGRARRAAALARAESRAAAEAPRLPTGLVADARALLAFASLAVPPDSLRTVTERVQQGIRNSVAPQDQQRVREELLLYPAVLAFPSSPLPGTSAVAPAGGYLGAAILAWLRGDTAGTVAALRRIEPTRAGSRPADLSIDALFVESSLLADCGRVTEATARLGGTLDAARWFPPLVLEDPARAGTLLRAMALRADLAARQGDAVTAARWARAVVTLWTAPDPELLATVARMRSYIARS